MKVSERQIRELSFVVRNSNKADEKVSARIAQRKAQEEAQRTPLTPEEKAERRLKKQIDMLVRRINESLPQGYYASQGKLRKFSSAIASIKITSSSAGKGSVVAAIDVYRSVIDYHQIGSIAVYSNDISTYRDMALRSRSFFGLPAKKVQILGSIRSYLNITVRA